MAITQVLAVVLVLATTTAGTPAGDFIRDDLRNFENVDIPLLQKKNVRYDFAYSVQDDDSGSAYSHQEERNGDVTKGEYRVTLPDGRLQIVSYTADENGYRANVSYEPIKKKEYKPPVVTYPQYKPEPEYILVGEPGYAHQGYGRRRRPKLRRPNRPRSRVQVKPQPEEIFFAEEEILVAEPEEVLVAEYEYEDILVHEHPEEYVVVEPEEIVVVEEGYLPPVPSSHAYTTPRSLSLTPTPNYLHKPINHYLPPLTPTPYHPPQPSPTPHYLPPLTPAPYHAPKPSPTPHYLPPVGPYSTPIAKSIPLKTTITPYGTVSPEPYYNPYFPPTAPRSTISPLYANHPLYHHPTSYKPSLSSLIYTPSPKVSTPYPAQVTTPMPYKVTTLHSVDPVITTLHSPRHQPSTRAPHPRAKISHKPRLSTLPPIPAQHHPNSLIYPSHNPSPYSPTPPPYPLSSPGPYNPAPPLYGGPSAEPYYPSYLPFFGPQYGPHFPGPSYPPRAFPTSHPHHGPTSHPHHGPTSHPHHGPTNHPFHGPSTPLPLLSPSPYPRSYHLKG